MAQASPSDPEPIGRHALAAAADLANDGLEAIEPWPGAEQAQFHAYAREPNRSRFRRMLDFAAPGTSVFEIGCGPGFTAAVLARHAEIARYRGVDLNAKKIAAFQAALACRAFDPAVFGAVEGDLYALTPGDLADADLVLCCEVLEHLPDPDKALTHIAETMPAPADLLFTVPLYGRLEAVWGHRSVFDLARLDDMCEAAGLTVHHVEPLANTWTLVAASRGRHTSARVAAARDRTPASAPRHLGRYDFVEVEPAEFEPFLNASASSRVQTEEATSGARCVATASDAPADSRTAGLGFDVPGLLALRFVVGAIAVEGLERFEIDAYAGADVLGRWSWSPTKRWRDGGPAQRLSLRANEASALLDVLIPLRPGRVDHVDFKAVVREGGRVEFKLRAAYLPGERPATTASRLGGSP
ncbi:MAG: class I SAM-dependent methyltransferase [Sporichthyaceae bacterium]